MDHIFFFSYASENLGRDNHLLCFFEDLCDKVSAGAPAWAAEDPRISFRDGRNLPLMDDWQTSIMDALQHSSVLVSVTSPAYFAKRFCGQEYWVFERRREAHAKKNGGAMPRVVLPVIWFPVPNPPVQMLHDIQWQTQGISPEYAKRGLYWLKIAEPREYEKVVLALANGILEAWNDHGAGTIAPVNDIAPFDQIPNGFGDDWSEAADEHGWIAGPGVANFVFAAARDQQLSTPPGRYGRSAAEWRPYLPPEPRTVVEITRAALKKHSLLFRELAVDDKLKKEFQAAKGRKNLTLVLADPRTLSFAEYSAIRAIDDELWEGGAVLMIHDDVAEPWMSVQPVVQQTFKRFSQLKAPAFQGPVRTVQELDTLLDVTLAELRSALTQVEVKNKQKTDIAPAQISGAAGQSS